MRALLVLAGLCALIGAGVLVLEPLLDDAPRQRAEPAPRDEISGPFGLAERRGTGETAAAELAERLQVDRVLPRRPRSRAPLTSDIALARRMVRSTCRGTTRDCRQAVASAAIRRIWASLPREADALGKAQRLLRVGDRMSLTSVEVRNSVRAELDKQLTRAVERHVIGARRRDAAILCFDQPDECRLQLRDMSRPQA